MTRLYLNTKDIATIEEFLIVPQGSFTRLAKATEGLEGEEAYNAAKADEVLATVSYYETFGFGKVKDFNLTLQADPRHEAIGGTEDFDMVKDILDAQGVWWPDGFEISRTEGLHWC